MKKRKLKLKKQVWVALIIIIFGSITIFTFTNIKKENKKEAITYSNITNKDASSLKKLGYTGDDIDNKVETAITLAIENYPGQDGFKSTLLKELKVIVKGKKEESLSHIPTTSIETEKNVPSLEGIESESFEVREPLEQAEPSNQTLQTQEIVLPADGKLRAPTSLDQLLFNIDILRVSPLEDQDYIKFLTLKYGYYGEQFYSLGEISEILSLPKERLVWITIRTLLYLFKKEHKRE